MEYSILKEKFVPQEVYEYMPQLDPNSDNKFISAEIIYGIIWLYYLADSGEASLETYENENVPEVINALIGDLYPRDHDDGYMDLEITSRLSKDEIEDYMVAIQGDNLPISDKNYFLEQTKYKKVVCTENIYKFLKVFNT